MPANFYASAPAKAYGGTLQFTGTRIKAALLTTTYTPSLTGHVNYSDLTNELSTANGYTAGGLTVPTPTITTTAANSWGQSWASGTAYANNANGNPPVIRPSTGNGHLYRMITAGTSGGSAPTWPTASGATVTDNTVVWEEIGESITVFSSNNLVWTVTGVLTFRYVAFYDTTTGVTTTEPLMLLADFGSSQSSGSSGSLTVSPDSTYGWGYTTPA